MKRQSRYYIHGFSILFLCFFSVNINAQNTHDRWLNLDEDEHYTARHECSFVQAGDKFIMFGGRENARQLDMYNFKNNSWSLGATAPTEFNHFQATCYQGLVWVITAFKTNKFPVEVPADNIWIYHPGRNVWIQGPQIPPNRRRGGAGVVIYKDKFYVVGGNTRGHDGGYVNWFDVWDPQTNQWQNLPDAPHKRDHFFAAVIGHKLYAAGGRHSGGEGGVFSPLVAQVDVFDFDTGQWITLPNPLPTPRAAPGVAVFHNELYVMGGEGEMKGPAFKTVEAYNPATGTWSRKADMHHPRHGTQPIVSGEGIYMAAGSPHQGGGNQRNMEVYNANSAIGNPLRPSSIITPEAVIIQSGRSTSVNLKLAGGNSGCYIEKYYVSGPDKNSFVLPDIRVPVLLPLAGEQKIVVRFLPNTSPTGVATLHIVYDHGQEAKVNLLGIRP